MKTKKVLAVVLAVVMLLATLAGCGSKAYPSKTIDATILFNAGFSADLGMRTLIDIIQNNNKGVTIVANNRTGGGGAVGYQYVLAQKADGYNICWNSSSISTTYHLGTMPEGQNYEAFDEVCGVTQELFYFAVPASAPYDTFDAFVDYAKAHPGELKINSSTVGCFAHLVTLQMLAATGLDMVQVFDDTTYVTGLVNGSCDMSTVMFNDMQGLLEAGDVKVLAVAAPARDTGLPDVKTMPEYGYDVQLVMYRGITVKAGTDPAIIDTLEKMFLDAAATDQFKEFCAAKHIQIVPMTTEEFAAYTAEQDTIIANLLESIGMKVQ